MTKNLRTVELEVTIRQRGNSHGDFTENGEIMQLLKDTMRGRPGWRRLSPYQREALDMIQMKVGRILSGDPNFADHWHDIAGYATIVETRLPKPHSHDGFPGADDDR